MSYQNWKDTTSCRVAKDNFELSNLERTKTGPRWESVSGQIAEVQSTLPIRRNTLISLQSRFAVARLCTTQALPTIITYFSFFEVVISFSFDSLRSY
jgi:hypothetical protein